MTPAALVREWLTRFSAADVDGLAGFCAEDATNHQVVMEPLAGREAIRAMFRAERSRATMTSLVEQLLEDGEWVIRERRDPNGLRGCGFIQMRGGRIVFPHGDIDQLLFFRLQGPHGPHEWPGGSLDSVRTRHQAPGPGASV